MSELTPSTWQVFKSVLASFFGVQNEQTRQRDFTHGKPGLSWPMRLSILGR